MKTIETKETVFKYKVGDYVSVRIQDFVFEGYIVACIPQQLYIDEFTGEQFNYVTRYVIWCDKPMIQLLQRDEFKSPQVVVAESRVSLVNNDKL